MELAKTSKNDARKEDKISMIDGRGKSENYQIHEQVGASKSDESSNSKSSSSGNTEIFAIDG